MYCLFGQGTVFTIVIAPGVPGVSLLMASVLAVLDPQSFTDITETFPLVKPAL